jgi:hypothetical protein
VLVMGCGLVVLTHLAIKYSSNGRNPVASVQFHPTSAVSGLGMTSPLI